MGSSIKPPGAGGVAGTEAAEAAEAAEALAEAEEAAQAPEGAAAASSPTETWIARLEAGEVSQAEAVDGIVADSLEAHGGNQLDVERRRELEGILRGALEDDPVLGALLTGGEA